jgi:hypothetical protein
VEPLPAFFGFYPRDRSVRLDAFARAAAAVGIRAEPFSDRDVFCGTNGPVFAAFYQAYRAYPYAVFASEDAQELDRVTFAFQGEIPMERIAPKP